MNEMWNELLATKQWLEQEAARKAEKEFAGAEAAIERHKESRKRHEKEVRDVVTALKLARALDEESQQQKEIAERASKQAEEELAGKAEVGYQQIAERFAFEAGIAGAVSDWVKPYAGTGLVNRHNEGGVTEGSYAYDLAASRMYPFAKAQGAGTGWTDDNDVTTYTTLYFAFLPPRVGNVRAYVQYVSNGWYQIRSDDTWNTSKEALIDLALTVTLAQNYWGGTVKRDIWHMEDDNIDDRDRLDQIGSLYSDPLDVGANKWVIAEVKVRAHVETEGSGSIGVLNFAYPDFLEFRARFHFA